MKTTALVSLLAAFFLPACDQLLKQEMPAVLGSREETMRSPRRPGE